MAHRTPSGVVHSPLRRRRMETKMITFRRATFAGALLLLLTASALADAEHGNGGNGNHYGWSRSAPGPEIGVGLPALLIGGYFWFRHRYPRNRK
jgi:hypothetical protein